MTDDSLVRHSALLNSPVASETVEHVVINGKPWTLRTVVFERIEENEKSRVFAALV